MYKAVIFREPLSDLKLLDKIRNIYVSHNYGAYYYELQPLIKAFIINKGSSLEYFDLVMYDSFEVEIIYNKEDLIIVSEVINSTRESVSDFVRRHNGGTEDYYSFRTIFSLTRPREASVEVTRDRDTISLYYKHIDYFDVISHFENNAVDLDGNFVSGFRNVLYHSDNENLSEKLEITCKNNDGITEINITHPYLNDSYDYTSFNFVISNHHDIGNLEEPYYENLFSSGNEFGNIEDYIYTLVEEFILNALYHDGKCKRVRVSVIKNESSQLVPYCFLFNYVKDEDRVQNF